MNIISNDGSNKLNRSRKARVSYKVQRTINEASTQRRARERSVAIQTLLLVRKSKSSSVKSRSEERFSRNARPISYAVFCLKKKKKKKTTHKIQRSTTKKHISSKGQKNTTTTIP